MDDDIRRELEELLAEYSQYNSQAVASRADDLDSDYFLNEQERFEPVQGLKPHCGVSTCKAPSHLYDSPETWSYDHNKGKIMRAEVRERPDFLTALAHSYLHAGGAVFAAAALFKYPIFTSENPTFVCGIGGATGAFLTATSLTYPSIGRIICSTGPYGALGGMVLAIGISLLSR